MIFVHMDGAKEFCHGCLEEHLTLCSITMQVTAPYAHSQNEKIKQYIHTLEDGSQTLVDSGLAMTYWGDAVLTTNYLHNCVPTSTLPDNVMPYEELEHIKPNLSHLCVWGCQCFVTIPLVLESLVQSGFLAQKNKTETETGPAIS